MEEKKKKSFVEMTALRPVPPEEKRSWLSVMLVQAGAQLAVTSMMLGSLLAMCMSFTTTLIVGAVGYILVTICLALVGVIGTKLRVPTCMVPASSFGEKGAQFFISIVFTFCLLAWFSMQNTICGEAFAGMMKEGFGIDFPVIPSILMWGFIMMITSIIGFGAMDVMNRIGLPILLVFMVIGCIIAVNRADNPGELLAAAPGGMSVIEGLGLVVGFSAFAYTVSPDCTRYQKTVKETVLANGLGIGGGGYLMLVMGALLTKIANEYDLSVIMLKLGFPIIGMIVLIILIWTSNVTNIWSGGLNAVMMFNLHDKYRWLISAILGVIGTVASAFGLFDNLSSFIDMLSVVFMPISGVFIADFYILCKSDAKNWKTYPGVNWRGFAAMIVGGVVCYLLMNTTGFNGVIGGVVAFFTYWLFGKVGMKEDKGGYTIEQLSKIRE